jgi:hypothetical protein
MSAIAHLFRQLTHGVYVVGLASISVAHLYNLRTAAGYRARRQQWAKTRPTGIAIGPAPRAATRRAPRLPQDTTACTKAMRRG